MCCLTIIIPRVARNQSVPRNDISQRHRVEHLAGQVHPFDVAVHYDQFVGNVDMPLEAHEDGVVVDRTAQSGDAEGGAGPNN